MLIMAGSPPLTALLGYLVFGEKLSLIGLLRMAIILTGIAIRINTGFISFTVLILYLKKWDDIKATLKDKKALVGITLGSIFGPFVGVSLSLLSLQYTSVGITSAITSIVPVTIIPLSIIVFKEKAKPKEILGAVVTVIGVRVLFLL